MVETLAPAKVNLYLRVYGKTDSGLHNLDSIVVFCQFGDKISISPADHDSFSVHGRFAPALTEKTHGMRQFKKATNRSLLRKLLLASQPKAGKCDEPFFSKKDSEGAVRQTGALRSQIETTRITCDVS